MENEKKGNIDIVIPKYQFAPVPEGEDTPSPIKRKVFKTMTITEDFTVYSVMEYLAKMQKSIDDKKAEVEGLENMKKAYLDELNVIEKQLGIQGMEDEFQHEIALANEKAEAEKLETNDK